MLDVGAVTIKDFQKHSVPAHMLAEYWYCAAEITNRKFKGEIESPLLLEGRSIHEAEAQKILAKLGRTRRAEPKTVLDVMLVSYENIRVALAKKKVLANSETLVLFVTVLPELGVLGIPDRLDCTDGVNPIILETKTTDALPTRPWLDHEIQVAAYTLGLERIGFHPPYGVLEYVIRNDTSKRTSHRIAVKDHLRRKVVSTAETVLNLLLEKEDPRPTPNPGKCVRCVFNESCRWKPPPNATDSSAVQSKIG